MGGTVHQLMSFTTHRHFCVCHTHTHTKCSTVFDSLPLLCKLLAGLWVAAQTCWAYLAWVQMWRLCLRQQHRQQRW